MALPPLATLYALWSRACGRPYFLRLAALFTSAWGALAGFMIYAIQLPLRSSFARRQPRAPALEFCSGICSDPQFS